MSLPSIMDAWKEKVERRMESSVFWAYKQAGYIVGEWDEKKDELKPLTENEKIAAAILTLTYVTYFDED